MMKKMLFVMNPFAGQRRANRYLADILTAFNRGGYDVTVYMTAGPGDCARMVEEKAPQMDLVVCCGGDGTFNEMVSGLLRSGADVPLGYIPAGSTNDFAASLGLSTNVMQATRAILEGESRQYDVGKFGDRYFTYVASFGAFTRASYSTPQNVKNALGHTAYLLEGISELSQLKNIHVRLELDDGRVIEDDFLFGAISNSTSVGGILTLDPKQVDMCDGRFELLLVRGPEDLSEIPEFIRALQTQKYNCRMMTFVSASRVKVTAPADMVWTLDGERAEGQEQVEATVLHRAIRLLQKG
jgi:YegS/Rv2252/BmrU family lipid kinase